MAVLDGRNAVKNTMAVVFNRSVKLEVADTTLWLME
jgi:hypothetical protein